MLRERSKQEKGEGRGRSRGSRIGEVSVYGTGRGSKSSEGK